MNTRAIPPSSPGRVSWASPVGRLLRDPTGVTHDLTHRAGALATSHGPAAVAILAGAALVVGAAHWGLWRWRHVRLARGAHQVLVAVPPEVAPESAAALWANLTGLLRPLHERVVGGQPHVAFEYVWAQQAVQIRIWVPAGVPPGLVERAVEAAWPAARAHPSDPPEPLLPAAAVTLGGRLHLARPDWFPLRSEHHSDPLRALFGATADLPPDLCAVVQICARPVTGRRLARAHRAAASLRTTTSAPPQAQLFNLVTPARAGRASTSAYVQHPERARQVHAILDKAAQPQWEVAIRYALAIRANNPSQQDATWRTRRELRRRLRRRLRGHAHALASAYAVYTGHNYLRRRRMWRARTLLERRWLRRGQLLSVPELAALAHLPWDVAVPGLIRAGAKSVAPSPTVPWPGPKTKPLGIADAGTPRPVAVGVADARHHLHVLGATGSGKSTLLAHMILADAEAGRGAVVVDPKGDLVTDVIERLPESAIPTTVLLDPDERHARPVLNVLRGPDRDLAVDNLVGVFSRVFAAGWGPRSDDILRASCLTLWNRPGAGLADIPRLLLDGTYRAEATSGIRDPILAGFWREYETLPSTSRASRIAPLLNKLRALLLRDFVRTTVGGGSSTVDLDAVLNGGLLLVRVPKGVLGAEAASLTGSLITAKVWEIATHRIRHGQAKRQDAALYIDEADNFMTLPRGLSDLLAEARAYHLSVVLAHQNRAQLTPELRDAISANARNKIYFNESPEDAHNLTPHVAPYLSEHDLSHLGGYQAAARLLVGATETPAFTLHTQPLLSAITGRARLVRRASRSTYGRPSTRTTPPINDPRLSNPAW